MQQHQPNSLTNKLDEAPHRQDGADYREKIKKQADDD
jgi:hypothetical protein